MISRNMTLKFLFILLVKICYSVNCYKILIVCSTPAPSHHFLLNALGKGLANAGHDVTLVSPYEEKHPPKNGTYTNILLNGATERLISLNLSTWFELGSMHPFIQDLEINNVGIVLTDFAINHPNFQKLINSNQKFDVIVLEQFLNDALKVLACHFKAPLISFSTFVPNLWINSDSGNPFPKSYVPDPFLTFPTKMSLWQRIKNILFVLSRSIVRDYDFMPKQVQFVKNNFPHCWDGDKFRYNASLTFVNYHESINSPVPLVPSLIPIGGFHIEPPKKLPKNLQMLMDNAKEGVIYFSLGSNVITSAIPEHSKQILIRVLGKRKEKILCKWNEEIFPRKPDNFIVSEWLPQQEILGHPNLKLFVSHGGLLSTIESVYNGVPILTLPVFAEQGRNGITNEELGYGLSITFNTMTESILTEMLNKLIDDPKYRKVAKEKSALLNDRPMKPLDLAIYWVEFVARNKGASHLRVAGADLPWYQYYMVDVVTVMLSALLSLIVGIYNVCKYLRKTNKSIVKIKVN